MVVSIDRNPQDVMQGVLRHCESLRVDGETYGMYRYSPICKPTYWASAFAALARNLFSDLDNLTGEQRRQWIDYLAGGQDEETGLYIDPVFKSAERISPQHTDKLLFWHSTTFILTAVEILGGKHAYPVRAVHDILTPDSMVACVEQLPWKLSPWVVGNWTYDIGCLVGHDYRVTENPANLAAMEALTTYCFPRDCWYLL